MKNADRSVVHVVQDLFSPAECEELIGLSERLGFQEQLFKSNRVFDVRNRTKIDDPEMANQLWKNLQPRLWPLLDYFNEFLLSFAEYDVNKYTMTGLNDRFRFYKCCLG